MHTYLYQKDKGGKTMAVTAQLKTRSLAIEVQSDIDKAGDPIYSKKSFSGVKTTATDADIFSVATSIKGVLDANTRETIVIEAEELVNA
jgi:Protein of unknown function (DUF1659).